MIATFVCAGIGCLFGSGTQPTIVGERTPFRSAAPDKVFRRSLTFAERVAFQRAIEDVYWQHRIWPKESQWKPPMGAIVSQRQIEHKVEDYLRKSRSVANLRGTPICASELQREMERMAGQTRQPETLRELFAALGNDPYVIAECLAGPILVERLLFESHLHDVAKAVRDDAFQSPARASEASACYTLPDVTAPSGDMNDTWSTISAVLGPRFHHSAIWTGSEMIIWGGENVNGVMNTGARYNPATDSWTPTSTINAPAARSGHSAVWTGTQMIAWGGVDNHSFLDSGSIYNPVADVWMAISAINAPAPRTRHTGIWTGNEMIIWGGRGCGGNCNFSTGGRYDPNTDSWVAISVFNAPSARFDHTAVWTGNEMIIWSGTDAVPNTTYLRTGGRYNPATDSWMPTSLADVPLARVGHTATWTGGEMVVWGGVDETFNDASTGGRYNPGTDSWVATSLANAPTARDSHTALWTGSEIIIWGGHGSRDLNTGGRYNPGTNSWTPTTTANAPFARTEHTAVWTGTEMIVWGGLSYDTGYFVNTGGSYSAQPSTPTVHSAVSRKSHGDASFDVNLPLSGTLGIECRDGGATGDYTILVTFLANVSMNANPQAAVTSGVGTIGSGGVGNGGMVMTSGNVVTIPLTNVTNAQTINVTLNNVNGSTNVIIPMRVLIGDVSGNSTVNATDVSQTKSCAGQGVSSSNFRCDVNAGGAINATDVSIVKAASGIALPSGDSMR